MKNWKRVAIATGAITIVGAITYSAYKFLRKNKNSSEDNIEFEAILDKGRKKMDLIPIMDEVLIESLDKLSVYFNNPHEKEEFKQEEERNMVQYSIEFIFHELEKTICKQNGWKRKIYVHEIKKRYKRNDHEVIKRLQTLDDIFKSTLEGKKPSIIFDFDRKYTKEIILTLNKWIICSHLYSYYQEFMKYNKSLEEDDLISINMIVGPGKEYRR